MKSKSIHIVPAKTNLLTKIKPENKFLLALILLVVVPFILVSHVTLVVMLLGWIVNSILPKLLTEIIPSIFLKLIGTAGLYTLSVHGFIAMLYKLELVPSRDLLNYAKSTSTSLSTIRPYLPESSSYKKKLTIVKIACVNCGCYHENPTTNLCSRCGKDIYVKQEYHSCESCGSDYDIELTECPVCGSS